MSIYSNFFLIIETELMNMMGNIKCFANFIVMIVAIGKNIKTKIRPEMNITKIGIGMKNTRTGTASKIKREMKNRETGETTIKTGKKSTERERIVTKTKTERKSTKIRVTIIEVTMLKERTKRGKGKNGREERERKRKKNREERKKKKNREEQYV